MRKSAYVYIMTNAPYGTLYTGVTSDLVKQVWRHKEGFVKGLTKTDGLKRLGWYEHHASLPEAVAREKALKRCRRDWKVSLIQSMNPRWDDLYESITH